MNMVAGLLLFSGALHCAELPDADWKFLHDKEGVQVYSKHYEGSSVVAFRGEAVVEASPAKVAAVLVDVPRKLEWVHAIQEARLIRQIGPLERIEYNRTHTPWPLTDRDFVFHAGAELDSEKGQVRFLIASVEEPSEGPREGLVRGRLIESSYTLEPLEGGKRCKISVQVHADPMGSVPKWIINLFQKKWPLRTIHGIREQVKKEGIGEQKEIAEFFAKRNAQDGAKVDKQGLNNED